MGNACFSHCQKNLSKQSDATKRHANFLFFSATPTGSNSSSDSESSNVHQKIHNKDCNYYHDDDDDIGEDEFFDSEAFVWFDAFENFPDEYTNDQEPSEISFSLSAAALKMIRTRLKDSFPNDRKFLNDDYIRTMACQAYRKDRNPRRAIETCIVTLSNIMKWRDAQNLSELPHLVSIAAASTAQRQRWRVGGSQLKKAQSLVSSLNSVSGYWHGLTKEGRPIFWIHLDRLLCEDDHAIQAHMMALQLLADVGIQYGMPSGIANVCVIIVGEQEQSNRNDHITTSPSTPRSRNKLMSSVIEALTEGYPHRIHQVWMAVSDIASSTSINIFQDEHPDLIDDTIVVCQNLEECGERLSEQVFLNGWEDLPTFLGGRNTDHDQWYCPVLEKDMKTAKGDDSLTFDFYGMKDRMMEQKAEYEKDRNEKR